MKLLVLFFCGATFILTTSPKTLPEYLPSFCPKSTPNYNECFVNSLRKLGPYLLKGVRAINFPKLNPLHVPLFIANRTISEQISISAVIKDAHIWGYDTTEIKGFRFDPETRDGELRLHIDQLRAITNYAVTGQLLSLPLASTGVFNGNATDVELFFKFSLKPVDKLGVTYYTLHDFVAKSTIGSGVIKMISKNPEFQFAADLITNFFNEDPKRTIDAVHPIYEESVGVFYKSFAEQVLAAIPAEELIPESSTIIK